MSIKIVLLQSTYPGIRSAIALGFPARMLPHLVTAGA